MKKPPSTIDYDVTRNRTGDFIMAKLDRPDWDNYFMAIAHVVATRSNCSRRQVAAVIVKDTRIISTGYNGTPRGIKNCDEGGCPRCSDQTIKSGDALHECFCSHAEENSIVQAAYHGIAVKDSTLYTTFSPCLQCAKMIINAGIAEVVYHRKYSIADSALLLLREAGVCVRALITPEEKKELGID
ncbi:MAG: dCMP deaminase family protein [Victivallaceae bacterium]|nr:dCMP deaminase family protein [Victivallaceae bacterium]MDD3703283.1 dCMP deaminase family protein [Victivallaceae bacterium]MDD4317941.1 dCMP deaminase family protein [Victivallaceae bacterium]